jgi:hypothetical protein
MSNIITEPGQFDALGQVALSSPGKANAIYQTASAIGATDTGAIRLVQTAST